MYLLWAGRLGSFLFQVSKPRARPSIYMLMPSRFSVFLKPEKMVDSTMSKANPLLSLDSGELIINPCDNSDGIRFGQALWVTLISFPAVLINVLPASQAALGVKDLIGLGIWASGFGLEILADSGAYNL